MASSSSNGVEIRFAERPFQVRKMSLGQYAEFSAKLEELLPSREDMESLIQGSAADRMQMVMAIFKRAPLRFGELMHIATKIPLETLMEATPDEVLDLAEQVYQLNGIDQLGERVKKVLSLGQTGAQAVPQR
jgi:hypothetical protein